ncbi:MAG: hypothetical protein KME15_01590 [Drouetiella hepatica Uher 2000/2452]|uniref:Uncharacterized protein n=1 Tax=Drouetiella hepatica Uher 2000/2452 TaxID=904376 RepID=A0A951Q7J5_9CYAN|nr:hypothetical protein [Drouetiella hepatica Uher 2000/2452]
MYRQLCLTGLKAVGVHSHRPIALIRRGDGRHDRGGFAGDRVCAEGTGGRLQVQRVDRPVRRSTRLGFPQELSIQIDANFFPGNALHQFGEAEIE